MQDCLPTIPIPLLQPDPDVPLDLSDAIHQVYAEADYDLTIDYSRQPPPPERSEDEQQWLRVRTEEWGVGSGEWVSRGIGGCNDALHLKENNLDRLLLSERFEGFDRLRVHSGQIRC